jgi:hypothetical protein
MQKNQVLHCGYGSFEANEDGEDRELPPPASIDEDGEEDSLSEKIGHPQNIIQRRKVHSASRLLFSPILEAKKRENYGNGYGQCAGNLRLRHTSAWGGQGEGGNRRENGNDEGNTQGLFHGGSPLSGANVRNNSLASFHILAKGE